MIVTLDGPGGAGKSTAAKRLADRLGFRFLNTGAMYRTVALAALRAGHDWQRPDLLPALARGLAVTFDENHVTLGGIDVSEAIRTPEITSLTRYASDNPGVREVLVDWQRAVGEGGRLVSDGRDQGTVVFPYAEVKFFLTADPVERARRRFEELKAKGKDVTFEAILTDQNQRDARDAARTVGPLKAADDALVIYTDGLTLDAVVDLLASHVSAAAKERGISFP